MTNPVFPGIAEFKAEPPMAGYGHQWQINGCVEDGNPDDIESYGWIAEVNSAWGNESGDLARFLARAANSHDALVAALEAVAYFWGRDPKAFGDDATVASLAGQFAAVADQCREALALARGKPS